VPTTKILIAGQAHKVMNTIFHHGTCIEKGHYTSMYREGTSSTWIEIDDAQITKKQWPKDVRDIYIFIFTKNCY